MYNYTFMNTWLYTYTYWHDGDLMFRKNIIHSGSSVITNIIILHYRDLNE